MARTVIDQAAQRPNPESRFYAALARCKATDQSKEAMSIMRQALRDAYPGNQIIPQYIRRMGPDSKPTWYTPLPRKKAQ